MTAPLLPVAPRAPLPRCCLFVDVSIEAAPQSGSSIRPMLQPERLGRARTEAHVQTMQRLRLRPALLQSVRTDSLRLNQTSRFHRWKNHRTNEQALPLSMASTSLPSFALPASRARMARPPVHLRPYDFPMPDAQRRPPQQHLLTGCPRRALRPGHPRWTRKRILGQVPSGRRRLRTSVEVQSHQTEFRSGMWARCARPRRCFLRYRQWGRLSIRR